MVRNPLNIIGKTLFWSLKNCNTVNKHRAEMLNNSIVLPTTKITAQSMHSYFSQDWTVMVVLALFYCSAAFFSNSNPCSLVFSIRAFAPNNHIKNASTSPDCSLKFWVTSMPLGVSLKVYSKVGLATNGF